MAERTMIERVAKAIDAASEEVSMAFMVPTINAQNVERYRDADRAKRTRQARAAIEALTVDDLEALLRQHLSAP